MNARSGKSFEKRSKARADVPGEKTASAQPDRSYNAAIEMQRAAGNQAVSSLLRNSTGRPLDAPVRAEMEAKFGESFADVVIHEGESAADATRNLKAKAFAFGRHIVFSEGRFAPSTAGGKQLLAHELAHVVQQSRGGSAPAGGAVTEQAAQDAANSTSGASPVSVGGASAIGAACAPEDEQRRYLDVQHSERTPTSSGDFEVQTTTATYEAKPLPNSRSTVAGRNADAAVRKGVLQETGMAPGHHIQTAVGAPPSDFKNVTPQNPIQNESGGTWNDAEASLRKALKERPGSIAKTEVPVLYRPGGKVPVARKMIHTLADGTKSGENVIFLNTSTPSSRKAAQLAAEGKRLAPGEAKRLNEPFRDFLKKQKSASPQEVAKARAEWNRKLAERKNLSAAEKAPAPGIETPAGAAAPPAAAQVETPKSALDTAAQQAPKPPEAAVSSPAPKPTEHVPAAKPSTVSPTAVKPPEPSLSPGAKASESGLLSNVNSAEARELEQVAEGAGKLAKAGKVLKVGGHALGAAGAALSLYEETKSGLAHGESKGEAISGAIGSTAGGFTGGPGAVVAGVANMGVQAIGAHMLKKAQEENPNDPAKVEKIKQRVEIATGTTQTIVDVLPSSTITQGVKAAGRSAWDLAHGDMKAMDRQAEGFERGEAGGPLMGLAMATDLTASIAGGEDPEHALNRVAKMGEGTALAKAGDYLGDQTYQFVNKDLPEAAEFAKKDLHELKEKTKQKLSDAWNWISGG